MTTTDAIAPPDRAAELSDAALDWLNSTFARTVALKLTPVLLPLLGALCVWGQDAIGIDMDPAVAAAFVVSVVLGAAAAIVTYVRNHGRGAALLGQALLELEQLYEAGRGELAREAGQFDASSIAYSGHWAGKPPTP